MWVHQTEACIKFSPNIYAYCICILYRFTYMLVCYSLKVIEWNEIIKFYPPQNYNNGLHLHVCTTCVCVCVFLLLKLLKQPCCCYPNMLTILWRIVKFAKLWTLKRLSGQTVKLKYGHVLPSPRSKSDVALCVQ